MRLGWANGRGCMATRIGYGKIDRTRERDIMADTGKSKGQ